MDSGVEVGQLRGSERVGVYVGACGSDAHAAWLQDIPNITGSPPTCFLYHVWGTSAIAEARTRRTIKDNR